MNNKPRTKKQWQAPKVFDLDVKDTKGGWSANTFEISISTFTSYYPTS